MGFSCPACKRAEDLAIRAAIALPSDSRSDEIYLQLTRCNQCGFEAVAVYEESRRGALDQEAFQHVGYFLGRESLQFVKDRMRFCPDPDNPNCPCPVHQELGAVDAFGSWNGLAGLEVGDHFQMQIAPPHH